MTELNKETVEEIAALCRIDVTETEVEKLLKDLQKILNYVEQLQEVDTDDVEPCNNVIDAMVNVMREDDVDGILPRDEFLANAPAQVGGMIRVPPVMTHTQQDKGES